MSDIVERIRTEGSAYVDARPECTLVVGLTQNGQRTVFPFVSSGANFAPLPNDKTLYEIGSFSKVYTTSLLSVLVRLGVLSLDDPIKKFVPQLDLDPDVADVTVFELATHSSGMDANGVVFDAMVNEAVASNDFANYTYYERYQQQHLYEELRVTKLVRPRRSGWEYSRTGLSILGHILELAAGAPYEELLKEHICAPLGLVDTTYTLTPEQDSRFVRGYWMNGQESNVWLWDIMLPQGGIRSTMDDMMTFLEANLAEDDSQMTRDLRFARETEFAWPEGYALPSAPDEIPPRFTQALGWRNRKLENGTVSEHAGATFSYQSVGTVHQESKTALCALTSSATNLMDVMTFPGFALNLMNAAIA